MKKSTILSLRIWLTLYGISFSLFIFSQTTQFPCADVVGPNLTNNPELGIIPFRVTATGNTPGNLLKLFNQNTSSEDSIIINNSSRSFIEIDLGTEAFINGIQFWYPNGITNFNNYYVYFSNTTLSEQTQEEIQNNEDYHHMHIASQYESGYLFEANFLARYITIINFTGNDIILSEIKIPGKKEICGNGLDDDCDGKVDCQDTDCYITDQDYEIRIKKQPTCPICCDGEIIVYHNKIKNIEYSFDGGLNWFSNLILNNLCAGDLNLKMKVNGGCNEIAKVITLHAPPGQPTSPCSNGDFENGNFQGFTGDVGKREADGRNQNVFWDNRGFDPQLRHAIISSGADPYIPQINLPLGGSYCMKLGYIYNPYDYSAARLNYSFFPEQVNHQMCFAFALVVTKGPHNHGSDPYFQYSIIDKATGINVVPTTVIVATQANVAFFSGAVSGIGTGDLLYRTWTCECIDIPPAYWDRQLEIQFVMAPCDESGHNGYAYIDGLCEPLESFNPTACFTLDGCSYLEPLVVDGSCSTKESRYKWTICQTNQQGQEFNCKVIEGINNVGSVNLNNLFNNNFNCDQDIKIKLEVWNDCDGYSSHEQIYNFRCTAIEPAENLVLCVNTGDLTQVILNPKIECNNCTYHWRDLNLSGIIFSDPTSATPLVTVDAHHKYEVELEVTNSGGCKTIKHYFIYPAWLLFYHNNDACNIYNCQIDVGLSMTVISAGNIVTLDEDQKIKFTDSGNEYSLTLTETNGQNNRQYSGNTFINHSDFGNVEWKPKIGNNNFIGLETCYQNFNLPEYSCYEGDLPDQSDLSFPTIVYPNSQNPENRYFWIQVNNSPSCTYNATFYELGIYIRAGDGLIIAHHIESCGEIIPNRGIFWNCKYGDDPAPPQVYTFYIQLTNCSGSVTYEGNFSIVY